MATLDDLQINDIEVLLELYVPYKGELLFFSIERIHCTALHGTYCL